MKASDLKQIALRELQEEEARQEIERLKQEIRQKRRHWLYRLVEILRYKKPVIKWEYRK